MGVTPKDICERSRRVCRDRLQGPAQSRDIGPEIRARVQKRIKELNYQPNLAARAIIFSSDEDPELERQEIARMLARSLDVLLIASAQRSVETFRALNEQRNPYVVN
jgi:LacI family transcriptional regulator